nr:hypothetical protein [Tanacetum cinerariifolium]
MGAMKELSMKCPQHYLMKMQEAVLFYNELGILTRQIIDSRGKVLLKRGFGCLPSSTEANPRDQVKSISTSIEVDSGLIRRIGSGQYDVSTGQKRTRIVTITLLSKVVDPTLGNNRLLVYEFPLSSLRKKYRLSLKNDMSPRDKFTRIVSIGGSRGVSPLEVHEEYLHRRFTRSVSIEGLFLEGFDRIPHKSVSFGSTTKVFQEKKTQGFKQITTKCFNRRGFSTTNDTLGSQSEVSSASVETLSADALPTIAPIEAPHSRNHVKSPQTQDTSIENASSDRRSKKGDKIGKELLHLAPSPYYMSYPYDEDLKMCKAIIDQVPTPTLLLRAEGLTPKKLSDCMNEAQLPAQVEHLSAELSKPKGTNHALEKENHSRCKKYKKYKARRDSLVLEKEKLKNKLLEILTASKKDKESFAQGKSQLDLQEIEPMDLKHQPFNEQSKTHKLKNAIIERERDLFEYFSKRTSRDLFKNSSRVASTPKHLLVSTPS